jgi:hypothetical protein
MPDAMRDVPPFTASPAAARRGRRDERLLSKLRLAALVAREHGVTVRVHGIEICNKRKPSLLQKEMQDQVQQKPAVPVAPTQHPATTGAAPPPPPSPRTSRQRRSSRRLLVYQEKKRVAAVAEFVSRGVDPVVWPSCGRPRECMIILLPLAVQGPSVPRINTPYNKVHTAEKKTHMSHRIVCVHATDGE